MTVTVRDVDKYAGVLVGLATGDALGAGYEFGGSAEGPADMGGGGLGGWDPGEWTDDTQMALSIAEEAATGTVDPEQVAKRFLDWFNSGPADVGVQTRSVLVSAGSPSDLARAAASFHERNPQRSAGNGSLMRTAPVALSALGNDEELRDRAVAISRLTHADPLAEQACILWCVAIDRAVRQSSLYGVEEGLELLDPGGKQFWKDRINEAKEAPPQRFGSNAFVVTAFQAALAAIWHTPVPEDEPCRHLETALRTAVNIGGDSDTVGAIAGSLLGGRWGASAVPVRWRLLLHGWPGYRDRDLVRLGVMAARHGQPDEAGWPVEADMKPFYQQAWPGDAIVRALDDDNGVLLANVAGAYEASSSVDVVVSLCRMGATRLPSASHIELWLRDSDDPAMNPNLDFIFKDLAMSLIQWRAEGKRVMVHCVQAERRTPAVAAAYLAQSCNISGHDAFERVRAILPRVRVNEAFYAALCRIWP